MPLGLLVHRRIQLICSQNQHRYAGRISVGYDGVLVEVRLIAVRIYIVTVTVVVSLDVRYSNGNGDNDGDIFDLYVDK